MNLIKIKIFIVFNFFLLNHTVAQFDEIKKLKLTKPQFLGNQYSLNGNGLLNTSYTKNKNLSLEFFDTDLKKINSFEIPATRGLIFKSRPHIIDFSYDTILNKVFIFHDYYLTYIEPDGSKKGTSEIDLPNKFNYDTKFVTVGDNSFSIVFKTKGIFFEKLDYTTLAKLNWKNGKIEPMPLLPNWKKKRMVKLSYVNEKYFSVMFQDNSNKKQKSKNIALFDAEGNILVKKLITAKSISKPVIDYKIADFGNSELIVFGTYGSSVESDYSQGIIISKQIDFKTVYIKHIDFTTIKDFYKYLPERQRERVNKKVAKIKKRGKHIDVVSYSHQPIKIDDVLVLATEFCYPTYHAERRTTTDAQGHVTTETVWVFDGFVYTHAIVLGINDKGDKVFEHFIPVSLDYKPFKTVQAMKLNIAEKVVNYTYAYKGQIHHYSITDTILKEHPIIEMDKKNPNSKKTNVTFSDLNYWHENFYYATTAINIDGPKKSKKHKKQDYFIIKYELNLEN